MLLRPGAGAAEPSPAMPAGAEAQPPPASPGRGPMAPGWAVLVMLVLSILGARGAVPPPEPGQYRGVQWVWGAAGEVQAEPLLLSRRKRGDSGQEPSATTMPSSNDTDSPELNLPGSVPPPAPSTNDSLHRALAVPTTADLLDETDVPELLVSSAPSPTTNASLHQARAAPTTADPWDETDGPDLLPGSTTPIEPGTQAATQNSVTTILTQLMSLGEEGTAASSTASSSSATSPPLGPTTTAYKEIKKSEPSPMPTRSAPWDTTPRGTTTPPPWDPSGLMGKCLLAILLLALVAATFMVCTGVLGARLWRRARTAHRRLTHTEMVCISSLLPDGEVATNGPKSGPARRSKPLLDGGSEFDGDNLTLSSFLPEHS